MLPEDFALLRRVVKHRRKDSWTLTHYRKLGVSIYRHPAGWQVEVDRHRFESGKVAYDVHVETSERRLLMAWPRNVTDAVNAVAGAGALPDRFSSAYQAGLDYEIPDETVRAMWAHAGTREPDSDLWERIGDTFDDRECFQDWRTNLFDRKYASEVVLFAVGVHLEAEALQRRLGDELGDTVPGGPYERRQAVGEICRAVAQLLDPRELYRSGHSSTVIEHPVPSVPAEVVSTDGA